MKDYLAKKNELNDILEDKANELVWNLIHSNTGKTINVLRVTTLDFIRENQLPEEIAIRVKRKVDDFISQLKIPAQKI